MLDLIENMKDYLEDVELEELTQEQRTWIRDNSNTYVRFQYGLTHNEEFVIRISKESFNTIEYYLGLEYERSDIVFKIEYEGEIIVVYEYDNERLKKLFEYLMPEKFCDAEE